MTTRLKDLGIDRLSMEDRMDLAREILESVESDFPDEPLTDEQCVELDRRIANHQANPTAAIAWEQVEAEALNRIRR